MLQAMVDLAATYKRESQYAKAEPLYQQALQIRQRVSGLRGIGGPAHGDPRREPAGAPVRGPAGCAALVGQAREGGGMAKAGGADRGFLKEAVRRADEGTILLKIALSILLESGLARLS